MPSWLSQFHLRSCSKRDRGPQRQKHKQFRHQGDYSRTASLSTLPIKVKIKREKERLYRDLDNENWARDFEIEVKNTGEKPIYFLLFALGVPDAKIADSYQFFTIVYGRVALSDLNNRPTSEDVPIRPGETKVLKIEDEGVRGWDEAGARGLVPRRIRGAKLLFQDLKFGDVTGFEGGTGAPRPKSDKEPNGRACLPPTDAYGGAPEGGTSGYGIPDTDDIRDRLHAGLFKPASFLVGTDDFSAVRMDPRLPEEDNRPPRSRRQRARPF